MDEAHKCRESLDLPMLPTCWVLSSYSKKEERNLRIRMLYLNNGHGQLAIHEHRGNDVRVNKEGIKYPPVKIIVLLIPITLFIFLFIKIPKLKYGIPTKRKLRT